MAEQQQQPFVDQGSIGRNGGSETTLDAKRSSGLGMPRTRTSSMTDFGYTRKVGFETFEKMTESAMFVYTLQVS